MQQRYKVVLSLWFFLVSTSIFGLTLKESGHLSLNLNDVIVEGNYAYIADDYKGISIINVSDPRNPSETGTLDLGASVQKVFVEGNTTYAAIRSSGTGSEEGVAIIDTSDKGHPVQSAFMHTTGAWDVTVRGRYAYVADDRNGLVVFDISDKQNPVEMLQLSTGAFARDVLLEGDTLYISDSWGGLRILKVQESGAIHPELLYYLLLGKSDPEYPGAFQVPQEDFGSPRYRVLL